MRERAQQHVQKDTSWIWPSRLSTAGTVGVGARRALRNLLRARAVLHSAGWKLDGDGCRHNRVSHDAMRAHASNRVRCMSH